MLMKQLRDDYHKRISSEIIRLKRSRGEEYPNFADSCSHASVHIAKEILNQINSKLGTSNISEQQAGKLFENITRDYFEQAFASLQHLSRVMKYGIRGVCRVTSS
jgi:hypothetical protein